jgi:hypothetical protein
VPAGLRAAVSYVEVEYEMSERHACRLLGRARSTHRYRARRSERDATLRTRLKERAAAPQQNTIASSYHRAKCGARARGLCEMWLRLVANIDANERTENSLLQVHWLRQLAETGRPSLR